MKKSILAIIIIVISFVFMTSVNAASHTMTTKTLDDGTKYDLYVPNNINSNTRIVVYSAPFNNGLEDTLANSINNSNVNAIVIFPKIWGPSPSYSTAVFKMVNNTKSAYNITTEGYVANGYSQPGWTATSTMVDYLEENPNSKRQLILLNDGYVLSDGSEVLRDDEVAVLEKNNTLIVDYCQNNNGNSTPWRNVGTKLLNSNLDILFVSPSQKTDYSSYHNVIYYQAYSSGIYSKILAFLYEGGDLPSSGFVYRVYNHNTKQVEEYTAAQMKQKYGSAMGKSSGSSSTSPGGSTSPTTEKEREIKHTDISKKDIEVPEIDIPEMNFCGEARVLQAFRIIGVILFILKIAVPVIIIIFGTIDLAKALMDSNDKSNHDAIMMFVKRLIIGVVIFLIPTILDLTLSFVDGASETTQGFSACTSCLLNPFGGCE